jgi:hypothetical protein
MNHTDNFYPAVDRRRVRDSDWRVYLAVMLMTCCGVGCYRAATSDEAEHERPAHKPYSVSAAVERLEQLHGIILSEAAIPQDRHIDVFAEYIDVVRWLPELAADSDLSRERWEQIDRRAAELLLCLESLGTLSDDEQREAYRRQRQRIEEHLEALRGLVPPVALETEDPVSPLNAGETEVS